jgi:hypothetical protein
LGLSPIVADILLFKLKLPGLSSELKNGYNKAPTRMSEGCFIDGIGAIASLPLLFAIFPGLEGI